MKIIAINGSYRRGYFSDNIMKEIDAHVSDLGHQLEIINLTDAHIEFCDNCRKCMNDDRSKRFGDCTFDDDMKVILERIDMADALILISPTNIGNVTAIMKKFIERTAPGAFWPWKKAYYPVARRKAKSKSAVVITSCAMPSLMLRVLAPNVLNIMRGTAKYLGFKSVSKFSFGLVGQDGHFDLSEKELIKVQDIVNKLLRR